MFHDTFKQSFQSHQNPPHNLQKLLLVIWVTPDKKLTRSNEKKGDIVTPKNKEWWFTLLISHYSQLSMLSPVFCSTVEKMEKKGKYTPKLMTSLSCIVSWWNLCFIHPIFRFWFLVTFAFGNKVTKILCNLCLHFARQDGQDGKKWKESHTTKVTKRRKYGMNKTINIEISLNESSGQMKG